MSDKNNKFLFNTTKEQKHNFDYWIIIFAYVGIIGVILSVINTDCVNSLFVIPSLVNIVSFIINIISNKKKLTKICTVFGLISGFAATIVNIWVIVKLHLG